MKAILDGEMKFQAEKTAMEIKQRILMDVNSQIIPLEVAVNNDMVNEFHREIYKNIIGYLVTRL